VALAVAALVLAGCGDTSEGDPRQPRGAIERTASSAGVAITIGSKNFTEQEVLGELYAQGLRAAGFEVATSLNLGDEQIARRSLERGVIDGYPEYTGTVLVSLCERAPRDLPQDPRDAFVAARDCLREDGLTAFAPTPFSSTNEVGVKRAVARKLRLRTISDLRRVDQDLTLHGSPECPRRRDCLAGLRARYGLEFRRFAPVPIAERHAVLDRGERVASIVFSTDPQIDRQDIVVLEDDRRLFPPAQSAFVLDGELAKRHGREIGRVVAQVQQGLTEDTMRELNARVDLDGRSPAEAAKGYLRDTGLVP
jgi:glycine betaine/choline ABC-type transport system substrate-binding protein